MNNLRLTMEKTTSNPIFLAKGHPHDTLNNDPSAELVASTLKDCVNHLARLMLLSLEQWIE